eukprot:CAMPEP_0119003946 /NCGR_PEP_ID=MMETSP1176-20130426/860_1 /TAXON_ID=265551 /ORGANISM="Synedropsis recta cf, Strain CCMP1620" /LENGTH=57 /DNA_ID=CAMNT_0006955597 /DNA_START=102 /DNA_END=275 /DNA_ORIENTATION=+
MGMFNATAGLVWSIDRVYYGPKGRRILRDQWEFNLHNRDDKIMKYRAELAKAADAAK